MSSRSLWLFASVLPMSVGLCLLAPASVSTALGCTGGSTSSEAGYGPGFYHSYAPALPEDTTAPADAVFVARTRIRAIETDAAEAAFQIEVKDESGALVAGTVEFFDFLGVVIGLADFREAAFVWRPSTPLTPGKKYAVTWSAGKDVGTGEISVGSDSQAAPAVTDAVPTGAMGIALAGSLVKCLAQAPCYDITLTLHQNSELKPAVHVEFTVSGAPTNSTYREFELVPVTGTATNGGEPNRAIVTLAAAAAPSKVGLGLTFAQEQPDYCVRLVTTDLRDGSKTESGDLCASGSTSLDAAAQGWSQFIGSCHELPHADLTDIWCDSHPTAIECGGSGEGGSGGGDAGVGGGDAGVAGGGGTGMGATAGAAGSGGNSATTKPGSDSGGCACGAAGSRNHGMAALLLTALAGLLGFRRRRA